MSHALTWIDRLRIERVVWTLDQWLYDLPRKARIARRRELRENLVVAAQDVGVTAALRNLGDSRQLAAEYLSAQFGEGARPSWVAAATFLLTGQLVFTSRPQRPSATASPPPTPTPPDSNRTIVMARPSAVTPAVTPAKPVAPGRSSRCHTSPRSFIACASRTFPSMICTNIVVTIL